jgi:hypothetical protein
VSDPLTPDERARLALYEDAIASGAMVDPLARGFATTGPATARDPATVADIRHALGPFLGVLGTIIERRPRDPDYVAAMLAEVRRGIERILGMATEIADQLGATVRRCRRCLRPAATQGDYDAVPHGETLGWDRCWRGPLGDDARCDEIEAEADRR